MQYSIYYMTLNFKLFFHKFSLPQKKYETNIINYNLLKYRLLNISTLRMFACVLLFSTKHQKFICPSSSERRNGSHNTILWPQIYEPRHDKTNKVTVRPAKTQISLGIRPVWSESSLCAQLVAKNPSFLQADSEDSDQTGRMPRLIRVFAGRTLILLVLSCRGSYGKEMRLLTYCKEIYIVAYK